MRTLRWAGIGLLLCACMPSWDAPIEPGNDEPIVIEVPKGATANGIGPKLVEAGLVQGELQWKVYLKMGNDATCIKAGKHEVKRSQSLNEVVKSLCGAPIADDVPFTVVEGWRIIDIDLALSAKGLAKKGEYQKVALAKDVTTPFEITATTLEGYLYPETYMVPAAGADVKKLIERQLATFQERWLSKHQGDLGKRTLDQVVVMASMLEREEPKPANRPLVAGILWKRIDTNNGLGVDATTRYPLEDWNDNKGFLALLRDKEHPYNTRYRKGLPPTAIGNPTISSLDAALNPEPTEAWYYLHDAQGNLHPAKNAQEHEANRAKYNVY
ncbi:MAG: endolytic transglycosylase MltG [Myxococcota bacterium]